eukprot:667614-Amorphochlora_amoeboformis.AAC.1
MELTDTPPFETIYLHGLVRDGQGKKMSKTTVCQPTLKALSLFSFYPIKPRDLYVVLFLLDYSFSNLSLSTTSYLSHLKGE